MLIILFLIWLLINGRFTPDAGMLQICITGAVLSGIVYYISVKYLGISLSKEIKFWKKLPYLLLYLLVLIKEIIISNCKMAGIILRKNKNFSPAIVKVAIPLKSNLCKVILANSITLTPGTITADLTDDIFTIHCIDASFAEDIKNCTFVKILKKVDD